jgi:hypothetical protein
MDGGESSNTLQKKKAKENRELTKEATLEEED